MNAKFVPDRVDVVYLNPTDAPPKQQLLAAPPDDVRVTFDRLYELCDPRGYPMLHALEQLVNDARRFVDYFDRLTADKQNT